MSDSPNQNHAVGCPCRTHKEDPTDPCTVNRCLQCTCPATGRQGATGEPICNQYSKGNQCIMPLGHDGNHQTAPHILTYGPLEGEIATGTWGNIKEEEGTFACPICGQDTPHTHTSEEIAAHRIKTSPKPLPAPSAPQADSDLMNKNPAATPCDPHQDRLASGAPVSVAPSAESAEEAWKRGFRAAQRMAASLDPWEEHLARNPIAATLSSPGQCVEVKNKLILAQAVPPYTPPASDRSEQ